MRFVRNFALAHAHAFAAAAMLVAIAGCGQSSDNATPQAVTTLELLSPDLPAQTKVFVDLGTSIDIRWSSDLTSNGVVRLTSYSTTDESETEISASASGGSFVWIVPATLSLDGEYVVRAYDPTATAADVSSNAISVSSNALPVAISAPFGVLAPDETGSDDTGSNGASDPVACDSNSLCDDGFFCNGVEACTNGFCAAGEAPCTPDQRCDEALAQCLDSTCTTNGDCGEGGLCVGGMCLLPGEGDALQGFATEADSGAQINFATFLTVGDVLRLESPDPAATAATSATSATTTPAPMPTPDSGGAAKLPIDACTCAWSVEPASSGFFSESDKCVTEFTIEGAGDGGQFALLVDTACSDAPVRYIQRVRANPPPEPVACTSNGECAEGEICADGTCAPPPPPAPTIQVLAERTVAPFVVQFDMRLTDAEGSVIPEGVTSSHFRVLENATPIDLTETNQFVTPAENLPLRIVLVLDYTNSMQASDAIGPMVDAARAFVGAKHFTATHQIGVVEFHGRGTLGDGFNLAVPLTSVDATGRATIDAGIPNAGMLESGLTRVWDAVDLAIQTLRAVERKTGEVQAIVFLTDGRDTTSDTDAVAILAAATEADREINLYPVGFGDVGDSETLLRELARKTGGAYFPAANAATLEGIFNRIALDLRGQWNLTYITPKNTGTVSTTIEFTWNDQTTIYETSFEASQLSGDIHTGVIEVLDRTYDSAANQTSFLLSARYVPRNIDRFRFDFARDGTTLTLQGAGGLTDPSAGWTLSQVADRSVLLFGFEALEYGAFGQIGIAIVPGNVTWLQVEHDNSVYDFLSQPKTIRFEGDAWKAPYRLTVAVNPDNLGTVSVSPLKAGYADGDVVQLTTMPIESTFDRWVGAGAIAGANPTVTITMDGDKDVTAIFKAIPNP